MAALIAQAITARFAAPAATDCALAAHGGTYRVSDNCALRRSCGDNLRASEKTAPAEEAAATPDSAETKAQTLSYAGAGESYKISVLEGVHAARCVAWTPLIDPPRGVWRVNCPKSPKRFCLFRRRQRHFLSHLSHEANRSVAAAVSPSDGFCPSWCTFCFRGALGGSLLLDIGNVITSECQNVRQFDVVKQRGKGL